MKTLIKNGRVIDPANNIDAIRNILIENGKIISVDYKESKGDLIGGIVMDAHNCWVVPGLIDMHVHLRDPGFLHKETIKTGTLAAAAGGFTTICCMPNTFPVIDTAETVQYINRTTEKDGAVRVIPIGSITKNLDGEEISEIKKMKQAGICAISDDGKTVKDPAVFVKAMKIAKELNIPVLSHCEPEEEIIERDILLAKQTGVRLHICHVSTKKGVELIRAAQKSGQNVTAEVAPHHFTLTENDNKNFDPNFKMSPPLRSADDRAAILNAIKDGTISVIATDHAPHHESEKNCEYEKAANGIIGLETAVPLAITELLHGFLTPLQIIAMFTINPAKILNLDLGHLSVGADADITIIDPETRNIINKENFKSLSRNTPFHGREVVGKVLDTICKGEWKC